MQGLALLFLLLHAGSSSPVKNYSCGRSHGNCVLNDVVLETESDLEDVVFPDISEPLTIASGRIPHFTRKLTDKLSGVKDLIINRLEVETLYIKPEINHLEAVENRIHLLEVDDKDTVYQMLTLDLSGNDLDDVSVLARCKQLRRLTLDGNKLDQLSMDLFEGMSELRQLSLANNHMFTFETSKKLHMVKLQSLSLAGNRLIELNVAMWDFPSLEQLDVSNNKLYLLEGSLDQFKSLRSVKLSGNHWKCEFLHAVILIKTIKLDADEPNRCREQDLIGVQRICCTHDASSMFDSLGKDNLGLFDDKWEDLRNLQNDFHGFKNETERKLVKIGDLAEERSLIERIEEIEAKQKAILEKLNDKSVAMIEIDELRSIISDHRSTISSLELKYSDLEMQVNDSVESLNNLRNVSEKLDKLEEMPDKLKQLEELVSEQNRTTFAFQNTIKDVEKQQFKYHLSTAAIKSQIGTQLSEVKDDVEKANKRNDEFDYMLDQINDKVNTVWNMLDSISEGKED